MNKAMLQSFLRLIITAAVPLILHQITAEGKDIYSLDWQALTSGIVVALLIVAFNYYNGKDPRYGKVEKDGNQEGQS
jgi:hypothetical protein